MSPGLSEPPLDIESLNEEVQREFKNALLKSNVAVRAADPGLVKAEFKIDTVQDQPRYRIVVTYPEIASVPEYADYLRGVKNFCSQLRGRRIGKMMGELLGDEEIPRISFPDGNLTFSATSLNAVLALFFATMNPTNKGKVHQRVNHYVGSPAASR